MIYEEIVFSRHAITRMFERGILPRHIRQVLSSGETIMEYPDDKPFPSRLILGYIDGRPMNEEKTMKCVICKEGETQPGKVTVTLERNGSTIIFREVPADVCDNCGEYYLTEELTEKLFERAENAIKNGAEVEILKFAA